MNKNKDTNMVAYYLIKHVRSSTLISVFRVLLSNK